MIVALDLQLAVGTATGIGVYQRDLAAALRVRGVVTRELSAAWLDPWRFDRRIFWDQVLFPLAIARSDASVVHATAGTLPFVQTIPTVVTVHDMAWFRVQHHTRGYARAYFGAAMRRTYQRAAAVIVDSCFARDEYLELCRDARTPVVVYPGVDDRFASIIRRPDSEPFALVVGTIEARKNLLAIVEAAAAIPNLRVVAVGPPTPYVETVRLRIAELGLQERVVIRGYIHRIALDELYARAAVALIPSRYEGFGYAVAEAACAGLPFIAARTSALSEVAQDAGPLIDPGDVAAWVETIRDVLAHRDRAQARAEHVRAVMVERFRWSRAAAAVQAVYAEALR